jgi:hypothetical protein
VLLKGSIFGWQHSAALWEAAAPQLQLHVAMQLAGLQAASAILLCFTHVLLGNIT